MAHPYKIPSELLVTNEMNFRTPTNRFSDQYEYQEKQAYTRTRSPKGWIYKRFIKNEIFKATVLHTV